MVKQYHTAWRVCPYCGVLRDGATNVTGDDAPDDGDAAVCLNCGGIAIFDASALGGEREPTKDELEMFVKSPRVQRAQLMVRLFKTMFPDVPTDQD